jgi:tetratricopeptide (TPR) repeat protein
MLEMIKMRSIFWVLMLIPANLYSQKGVEDGSAYGHGDDSIRCIKNLSLYREYVKHNNFADAIEAWRIVFAECPQSTKNVYIDGAKMYNTFIQNETDQEIQSALIDTLMMIYDQRIYYYKENGSVLGRKGVDLLRYRRDNPEKLAEGYGYLKESIVLLKNNASPAVLATFMQASYSLYEQGKITDLQLIDDYAVTSDIINNLLAREPDDENALAVRESIDLGFVVSNATTCQSLLNFFTPDYEKRKEEPAYIKRVVSFMELKDCRDAPLYVKAAEGLYSLEPSAEAAFNLAKQFLIREEYNKAVYYYQEAIKLETVLLNKADYYYQMGQVMNSRLKKPEIARNYALEVIKLRPDWGEPYILLGDAYASGKECFTDEFEQATVFWAAVDMFNTAKTIDPSVADKANERIEIYSKYFPDVETIFFYGYQNGDNYTVGCWINETTKVRSR